MTLNLDKLTDGSHRREWSGKVDGVDLAYPEVVTTVEVDARIHRLQDLVTVRGDITGRAVRPCDRCLNPAEVTVTAGLHVVIRQRSIAMGPEASDDGEHLLTATEEDAEIDLTDQIRDSLVVEMPMSVHCREDCEGLCPRCGADLNEGPCGCSQQSDDRWSGLSSITFDE